MKETDEFHKKRTEIAEEMKTRAEAPKIIREHTVVKGDTLSGIALKYYGNASEKHYMYIYDKNKDVIGDNPNMIMVGIKLSIFELPEDF
jgi:nucleoid-associated protein YgaU